MSEKYQGIHRVEVVSRNNDITVFSAITTEQGDSPWDHEKEELGRYSSFDKGITDTTRKKRLSRILEIGGIVGQLPSMTIVFGDLAFTLADVFNNNRENLGNFSFIPRDLTAIAAMIIIVAIKNSSKADRIINEQALSTIKEASQTPEGSVARTYPFKV